MIRSNSRWYGKRFMKTLKLRVQGRIGEAGRYIQQYAKDSMKEGHFVRHSVGGEAPYKQTHNLAESIFVAFDENMAEDWIGTMVGTDVDYASELEYGIGSITTGERPFLRPAVFDNWSILQSMFLRPIVMLG